MLRDLREQWDYIKTSRIHCLKTTNVKIGGSFSLVGTDHLSVNSHSQLSWNHKRFRSQDRHLASNSLDKHIQTKPPWRLRTELTHMETVVGAQRLM